jgi:hypothetical protein
LARRAARHTVRRATRRRLLRLAQARRRLLRLRRTFGCLGTSRGSSLGSSRRPPPRFRVPRHVTRLVMPLVVDYSASRRLVVDNSASRRLVVDSWLVALLVVDYFSYAARPGASARRVARRAACRVTHRRLFRLAQARCRLLRLRRASGCLGTSRGSSRGSSSTTSPRAGSSLTTSPTPCVRVPRHVARLVTRIVVDYFAYAVRPGASACRAARHMAHRRLLCAPRLRLAATLALLQPRRAS